jgi:bacterioferritin-associated ferredoxin
MFVCICNALKEKEMTCAIQQGACSALDVYESLGCQPKCGRCVPYVEEQLLGLSATNTANTCPAG